MKKFYISKLDEPSGISKYSLDFFKLVLQPRGFQFIDSSLPLSEILTKISSNDRVHIEIGIFQTAEIEILLSMTRGNYKNVSITLHDAPLLKYPFFEFKNPILNLLSKLYDQSGRNVAAPSKLMNKIAAIYVLTKKGQLLLSNKYHLKNVHYLPHIINLSDLTIPDELYENLLFFGFIGKNKGLEYALNLHSRLVQSHPNSQFYVIGTALGKQQVFYDKLKKKYQTNVHYLGYLSDDEVSKVYEKASVAILPFRSYRFYFPFSGSILYSLKKGSIVFTRKNNSINEIISKDVTGFYLTGNTDTDLLQLKELLSNKTLATKIRKNSNSFLKEHFNPEVVNRAFHE